MSRGRKNTIRKAKKLPDEIYQVNGLAYLEWSPKLAHIRILTVIVSHLQDAIKSKLTLLSKGIYRPVWEEYLPPKNSTLNSCRTLEIPVSKFKLGKNHISRLRDYMEELKSIRCVFPTIESEYPNGHSLVQVNSFDGIIVGYEFEPYSRKVKIHLKEELLTRLLFVQEGYSFYSLEVSMSLNNKYMVRLYWIICSWKLKGGFAITLENLQRILCLGKGYTVNKIISRIILPSQEMLEQCSKIWFKYRIYESMEGTYIVFKVKRHINIEELQAKRSEVKDRCFNYLMISDLKTDILDSVISKLEYEDIQLFYEKLEATIRYMQKHGKEIKNRSKYLTATMERWLEDWSSHYTE